MTLFQFHVDPPLSPPSEVSLSCRCLYSFSLPVFCIFVGGLASDLQKFFRDKQTKALFFFRHAAYPSFWFYNRLTCWYRDNATSLFVVVRLWPFDWTKPPSRPSPPSPALRRDQKAHPTLTGQTCSLGKGLFITLHTASSAKVSVKYFIVAYDFSKLKD